jgi:hypothetical protein
MLGYVAMRHPDAGIGDGAADALEKRARTIQEWPVDEGTFARVLTIATSVVAATIGRLILEPLGL